MARVSERPAAALYLGVDSKDIVVPISSVSLFTPEKITFAFPKRAGNRVAARLEHPEILSEFVRGDVVCRVLELVALYHPSRFAKQRSALRAQVAQVQRLALPDVPLGQGIDGLDRRVI